MAEWQPIETAPRDTVVIVGAAGASSETAFFVEPLNGWFSESSEITGFNQWRAFPPTHWMPLPEAPK